MGLSVAIRCFAVRAFAQDARRSELTLPPKLSWHSIDSAHEENTKSYYHVVELAVCQFYLCL